MTSNDVTEILQRLARIEEKVDGRNDHEDRLRRVEISIAGIDESRVRRVEIGQAVMGILVILIFSKAFGLNIGNPFS